MQMLLWNNLIWKSNYKRVSILLLQLSFCNPPPSKIAILNDFNRINQEKSNYFPRKAPIQQLNAMPRILPHLQMAIALIWFVETSVTACNSKNTFSAPFRIFYVKSEIKKRKIKKSYTTPNGVLPIFKIPFPSGSWRKGVCRVLWAVLYGMKL